MPNRTAPIVTISHDGFARTELQRRKVDSFRLHRLCTWCDFGPARFEYTNTRDDNNRPIRNWSAPFCSVGCYRAYYS